MSKRTAKFASAIFASLLAGYHRSSPVSHGAPVATDNCLSGPKGAPPAGGHWYYRIDRATKRACWYIGDEKAKVSRAAPENSPPAANSCFAAEQRRHAAFDRQRARRIAAAADTRRAGSHVFAAQRAPATAARRARTSSQRANAERCQRPTLGGRLALARADEHGFVGPSRTADGQFRRHTAQRCRRPRRRRPQPRSGSPPQTHPPPGRPARSSSC